MKYSLRVLLLFMLVIGPAAGFSGKYAYDYWWTREPSLLEQFMAEEEQFLSDVEQGKIIVHGSELYRIQCPPGVHEGGACNFGE